MANATIKDVKDFFGTPNGLKAFTNEWQELSDESKLQIKEGIGNGTFDYEV